MSSNPWIQGVELINYNHWDLSEIDIFWKGECVRISVESIELTALLVDRWYWIQTSASVLYIQELLEMMNKVLKPKTKYWSFYSPL